MTFAKQKNIPTVVDPKKKNFMSYTGVTMFKPNLKELKEGLKSEFDHNDTKQLGKAVEGFIKKTNDSASLLIIGVSISSSIRNIW